MCIIVVKEKNAKMPSFSTLKTCFENNSDGAGFMFAYANKVYIYKGFMKYETFELKVKNVLKKYGDKLSMCFHFRISTQAGKRADCTHPYRLSNDMNDLRKLNDKCDIGICHNGIIDLTSDYGVYSFVEKKYIKNNIDYNDTMKFITDYLSLIIESQTDLKNGNKLKLIEKLTNSRLAIMTGDGVIYRLGLEWLCDGGIWYSNTSYLKPKIAVNTSYLYDRYYYNDYEENDGDARNLTSYDDDAKYDRYVQYYEMYYNDISCEYDFASDDVCPFADNNDESYCQMCRNYLNCKRDKLI